MNPLDMALQAQQLRAGPIPSGATPPISPQIPVATQAPVGSAGMPIPQPPQAAAPGQIDPNMMEKFAAQFAQMPKEMQEKYLARLARDYEGEGEMLGRDEERAEGMREDMPGMRKAGGYSIAANPMEFLGKGFKDYQAEKLGRETRAARGELSRDKSGAIADMLRRLGGLGGAPGQ